MNIIPSILVKTEAELKEKLALVTNVTERIHLDIADGIFVPNTTIDGYSQLMKIDTDLLISVHLMVSKPENHIVHWVDTTVDEFIFHIESTTKAQQVIDEIHDMDSVAGVAINPKTNIDTLKGIVDQMDFVHFMTVEPGFYGGEFLPEVIEKIKEFHYLYPDVPIKVDGGITPENAQSLIDAGASKLIVGHYLFEKDISEALNDFKNV